MSKTNRCSHEGCTCNVPKDRNDNFCSEYCKSHGSDEKHAPHACGCKHGNCAK